MIMPDWLETLAEWAKQVGNDEALVHISSGQIKKVVTYYRSHEALLKLKQHNEERAHGESRFTDAEAIDNALYEVG